MLPFDPTKYPTMAEIRECLNGGGHIAAVYLANGKIKASLVWAPGHRQPMKPSRVNQLYSKSIIELTSSRKSKDWPEGYFKDDWKADYFTPGKNWK